MKFLLDDTLIRSLESDTLTPFVCQAINQHQIALADWQVARINGGTFGIVFRVSGTALAADRLIPWSLILKIVHNAPNAPIDRSDPAAIRYWRREPLIYQSGFLNTLSGDLVAPRCFGVVEEGDDEVWLWLEDMGIEDKGPWPLDQYGLTAQHLGQFSGRFVMDESLPTAQGFGRRLLHRGFVEAEPFVAQLPSELEDPLARQLLPSAVHGGLLRLWVDRSNLLDVLDQVPHTVCHRDTYRVNLFPRTGPMGEPQTVAIDWEDAAIGPVGEDIVSLIVLGLGHSDIELAAAQEFERFVFERYLAGLRESGWHGDQRLVRLGYTVAITRYAIALPQIFLPRVMNHDPDNVAEREEMAVHWGNVLRFIYTRIDEAYALIREEREP